jgi:nitrilase
MEHIPEDFPCREALGDAGDFGEGPEVISPGGSGIIAPDATWIAEPVTMKEAIVYAEIDLDRIGGEQMALDTAGNYNRPDVFQLTVDVRPKPPLTWVGADEVDESAGAAGAAG